MAPRSRNTRAGRARPRAGQNDSRSVEWENGLRVASGTQTWTNEDLAYLYEARRQGKAYSEIQKKLLRTCLAMRLKVYHMNRSNRSGQANGQTALEGTDAVAESGREDTVSETTETVPAEPPTRAAQPTSGRGCESMDVLALAAERAERAKKGAKASTAQPTGLEKMAVCNLLN